MRPLDVSGERYGDLLAIRRVYGLKTKSGGAVWLFRCCRCSNEKITALTYARRGNSSYCGCIRIERGRRVMAEVGRSNRKD